MSTSLVAAVGAWSQSGVREVILAAGLVYAGGYVVGALLVDRREDAPLGWAVLRTVSGLLLTTLAFLLSLVLALPWQLGPLVVIVGALALHGAEALRLPRVHVRPRVEGAVAGLLAACLVAPAVVSVTAMAPGPYPAVFFNADTPYFLEQVHSLAKTRTYPPPSLSNVGGARTYHFGVHGMTAFVVRGSGLRPHHAFFLVVLPLLTVGLVAAAFVTAQGLAPAVPAMLSAPLLLLAVPSFWYPFSSAIVPEIAHAFGAGTWAVINVFREVELWGASTIVGQNAWGEFIVLAALAAYAAAPSRGWRLAAFLVGTAIMVKTSTGIALMGGLCAAQGWKALEQRSGKPLVPALGAAGIGVATYVMFFVLPPTAPDFKVEVFPFFYFGQLEAHAAAWRAVDVAWLLLPALVARLAAPRQVPRPQGTAALAWFGLVPFLVVNATRAVDIRDGGGGATADWLQILRPVSCMAHAYVLGVVGGRWRSLVGLGRAGVVALLGLAILPPVAVASRYAVSVARDPRLGHEFADNSEIARALEVVPIDGTLVVTNDLRYPAGNFSRSNRQMQIPALFGHQAFAVNYAYEGYAFSAERLALQGLLQADAWSPRIDETAREYGWTHFLVRKDYAHPRPVPLELVFDSALYAVYRFP